MSGILETVQQQLSGGALQQISQQLGLDPATTQRAVTAALPVVLGGMAKHASSPTAAAAIHQEADNHSTPADMTTVISNVLSGQGGAGSILTTVLGTNQQTVQNGVSKASGLDLQNAGKLVAIIAPFVLAAISNKKQVDGLQPTQVAGTLQEAQQTAQTQAQRQSPQLGGILSSVMSEVMNR